jgi:hypothetical protein
MSEIDPERWEEGKVKRLMQNRSRFVEMDYILTGRSPHPSFTKIANAIVTEANITNETTEETTVGDSVPEPEVGCDSFSR